MECPRTPCRLRGTVNPSVLRRGGRMRRYPGTSEQVITIDGQGKGRTFEGIGALSAGACSRLLIDYPEPARSRILDYLFKPNYGASLHHLKVEIGGDTNSTWGSEPSHMHRRDDLNFTRGYEWWLMKEAKKRNPDIVLDALAWSAPSWIGNGVYFSDDMIEYIVQFIKGAKSSHQLAIDYVGIRNESPYEIPWIKKLKKTMRSQGLSTKIVAADQGMFGSPDATPELRRRIAAGETTTNWKLIDEILSDDKDPMRDPDLPAGREAVDVVGVHYPSYCSTPGAQASGIPLWNSEDCAAWWMLYVHGKPTDLCGDWPGAEILAKVFNRDYVQGRMTKTEICALITSYYDFLPCPATGLMFANTPWSGNYRVGPAIWAVAHTNQFATPGRWRHLDAACGLLAGKGSFVTLASGSDFSVVIETMDATEKQKCQFRITGGLKTDRVFLWRTTEAHAFTKLDPLTPRNGVLDMEFEPGAIYSMTTTQGQGRGMETGSVAAPFPLPHADDFSSYPCSGSPKYFSDQQGSFEVCLDPSGGKCLEQVVTQAPFPCLLGKTRPFTVLGDAKWTDYEVSVRVLLPGPGFASLFGRLVQPMLFRSPSMYGLCLWETGVWHLQKIVSAGPGPREPMELLASGTASPALHAWHQIKLRFEDRLITAVIDGDIVARVSDSTYGNGATGVGSGWNRACFADFSVKPLKVE